MKQGKLILSPQFFSRKFRKWHDRKNARINSGGLLTGGRDRQMNQLSEIVYRGGAEIAEISRKSDANIHNQTASSKKLAIIQRSILLIIVFVIAGWAGCATYSAPVILEFPPNSDLGELWLMEDANCFTCGSEEINLGRATGKREVEMPARHWYLSLRMPKTASALMPELAHPSLAKIGEIDLSGSDAKDDDLRYLAGMDLHSINLDNTKITGSGLRYLKPTKKWMSVGLEDCDGLDPRYLSHFKGWKNSTIRLVERKSNAGENTAEEEVLLQSARKIICDDRPEDVCGIQIR